MAGGKNPVIFYPNTTYYRSHFALKTIIQLLSEQDEPSSHNFQLDFGSVWSDICQMLRWYGAHQVGRLWAAPDTLIEVRFASDKALKKFLQSKQKVETAMAEIMTERFQATKPQDPSTTFMASTVLLLVTPNDTTSTTEFRPVTLGNHRNCVSLYIESKIAELPTEPETALKTVPEDVLTESDLPELMKLLFDIVDWYGLGLVLGIPYSKLQTIESDFSGAQVGRTLRLLSYVLVEWMQNHQEATWSTLVQALSSIGKRPAARRIAREYGIHVPDESVLEDLSPEESEKLQQILEEIKQLLRANCEFSDMQLKKIQNAIEEAQQRKRITLETFSSILKGTITKVKILLTQKENLEKQILQKERQFNEKEKELQQLREGKGVRARKIETLETTASALKQEVSELKKQLLETDQQLNTAEVQYSNDLLEKSAEISTLSKQTHQLMSEKCTLVADLGSKITLIRSLETSSTALTELSANLQLSLDMALQQQQRLTSQILQQEERHNRDIAALQEELQEQRKQDEQYSRNPEALKCLSDNALKQLASLSLGADADSAVTTKAAVTPSPDQELPYGWEKVNDPGYGTYFIDHVNRTTQYQNPITETKRKFAGAQLINMRPAPAYDDRAPPPFMAPPSFQSTAALEKQREAEAAVRWPDAGLRGDYTDSYPYPYTSQQMPTEHDLESELMGEVMKVNLRKTTSGFGITIIGGDRAGELLQIKSIVRGSVADRDGRLQVGDFLVRINGISVLTYNHKKVVDLFQIMPLNSDVIIEIRRGYPLPEFQGGPGKELPSYNESNRSMGYGEPMQNSTPVRHGAPLPTQTGYEPALPPQPEKLTVHIVKGLQGFGFSLGKSTMGPVVKQIMDHPRCAQLREGDILLEVNGEKVHNYLHSDLVTVLKRCNKGNQAAFSVLRAPHPQQEDQPPLPPGARRVPLARPLSPDLAHQLSNESFNILEIRLMRQITGFGFRIIGGKEEGSQVTVGAIIAGGAADLDGRLLVGDEITHINNHSVIAATHQHVIMVMSEAAAQGEVVLGLWRKQPMTGVEALERKHLELAEQSMRSSLPSWYVDDTASEDEEIQHIDIHRDGAGFGFSIRGGAEYTAPLYVLRIERGGAAENDGRLRVGDELLEINGLSTEGMLHSDAVTIVKHGGNVVKLIVRISRRVLEIY